jgi:PucR family transcriptional regulator, purine catabolism regulatory protein
MPISLRALLEQRHLALRTVWADDEALDRPWEWVHSSDLGDPTPFLSAGDALLTTGTQWADDDVIGAWVRRLADRGVPAIGFGTEVVREGTPPALAEACEAEHVALFEVPYRTPFIAVARAVADAQANERFARLRWTLEAQRAIAVAALKPDGLAAIIAELARRAGAPVSLLGADAEIVHGGPVAPATVDEARRMLTEGRRAAIVSNGVALQTLGRSDALRGVLAVGGAAQHDDAVRAVITSVVAMSGLALEQDRALANTLDHLRTGLLAALLRGERELVASTSRALWGALPSEPLTVAVIDARGSRRSSLLDLLESRAERARGAVFHARDGKRVVVIVPETETPVLDYLADRVRFTGGYVRGARYGALSTAVDEASRAADRASADQPLIDYSTLRDDGVLASLSGDDTRRIAASVLAPLDDHDKNSRDELVRTLSEWLAADAIAEAAAVRLGIHRHTVRARVKRAEVLLGRDLGSFPARAELWAALVAAGRA